MTRAFFSEPKVTSQDCVFTPSAVKRLIKDCKKKNKSLRSWNQQMFDIFAQEKTEMIIRLSKYCT